MVTQHRRDYIAKYNLERYHKRMQEAYEMLGGACVICGSTEDLQIDHFDPAKKDFTLAKIWSASQERFLEELTKCQLLCWKCHLAKTATFDKAAIMKKKGVTAREPRKPRKKSGILRQ
jgi:5-methylcytosine-specific restriction endonuclease McrA